jgi:hypothetical protein
MEIDDEAILAFGRQLKAFGTLLKGSRNWLVGLDSLARTDDSRLEKSPSDFGHSESTPDAATETLH